MGLLLKVEYLSGESLYYCNGGYVQYTVHDRELVEDDTMAGQISSVEPPEQVVVSFTTRIIHEF